MGGGLDPQHFGAPARESVQPQQIGGNFRVHWDWYRESTKPSSLSLSLQYDISKDIVALNSIRELLVMIRMWGLLKSQCLPVFCRFSDNCDVLVTVYRLLTKLALNPNEPDDMLLDECCLLPNQVSIPSLPVVSQKAALVNGVLNHVPVFVSVEELAKGV